MTRRDFLASGAALAVLPANMSAQGEVVRMRIAPVTLDIGPKRRVKTIAYNGEAPGPLLRWKVGQTVTIEVANETAEPELLHWHGFHIPPEVDGAMEEGTPMIPAKGSQRYTFTVTPAGTRWYHSHIMGGHNFQKGTYTGQFGVVIVEAKNEPGGYDLDVPIVLHEWEPVLEDDDVAYKAQTVNGRMLGSGEPVRVKAGQRVLFRVVNASATMTHRVALAGHALNVVALDGNPVAAPRTVPLVELGPGERADCIVEMKNPGVWVMGETRDAQRNAGMGIVVEYAEAKGTPRWTAAPNNYVWDYTVFGSVPSGASELAGRFPMQFKPRGQHGWTINGKAWPNTEELVVKAGGRYRMIFDNQSSLAHPVHLHRHTFEITKYLGKAMAGVRKDVVVVPAWKEVEVDLVAEQPGLSLFHCHQQFHMDMGFMSMLRYS